MKTLANSLIRVEIDEISLTAKVTDLRNKQVWQMQEEGPGDIGVKGHCGPYQTFMFRNASSRQWREISASALEATVTGWGYSANVWSPLAFGLVVRFEIREDKLMIKVSPHREADLHEASIIDSYYPRGFMFPAKSKGDLVLPYSQGTLLDKDDPMELDMVTPVYVGPSFVMPCWGHLDKKGAGILATTTTPDDLGVRICKDKASGMTAHPYWQASLGGFKYTRIMSYKFLDKASVMTIANEYRKHADTQGQGITLREKANERPMVDKVIGGAFWNIWLMSNFTQFENSQRVNFIRFSEAKRRYEKLFKLTGLKKVVAHIDGWGKDGYDYSHPDVLPPDPRLGGWAGLKDFCDFVHSCGHGFILHDNYVDFYKHTDSYKQTNDGVMNMDGLKHTSKEWLGGWQEWMCSTQSKKYVARNLDEIEKHFHIDGEYVDCWSIGHLRECYDQRHPATRTKTREAWTECFAEYHNRGLIVGSESGNDWAVPVFDFCHTVQPDSMPHQLVGKVPSFGKTIPFYNMVWHDCVICPAWIDQHRRGAVIKEGLVIPEKKDLRLWALLWGGIPAYRGDSQENSHVDDSVIEKDAEFFLGLKIISDFNANVGYEKITDWEMLDDAGMIQKTTFANGSTAEVDFNTGGYKLSFGGKKVKGSFDIKAK